MSEELLKLKLYLQGLVNVDDDAFDQFAQFVKRREVKKGELLLRAGNRCENLYFVNTGLFRIFNLKNGNEVNTCFCGENEITCSFESFTTQSASKEFIEALEDSTVLYISHPDLTSLFGSNPIWDELRRVFTDQECIRLSNRLDTLSFSTALEKYESVMENQKEIIQRVPIQHLASYLGISRETMSRVRSKMVNH